MEKQSNKGIDWRHFAQILTFKIERFLNEIIVQSESSIYMCIDSGTYVMHQRCCISCMYWSL